MDKVNSGKVESIKKKQKTDNVENVDNDQMKLSKNMQLVSVQQAPEDYHIILGKYYQSTTYPDDESCTFLEGIDKFDSNIKYPLSETKRIEKKFWDPIFKDNLIDKIRVWCKKSDFPLLYEIYQHLLKQHNAKPDSNQLTTLDNPFYPSKKGDDTFVVTFTNGKAYRHSEECTMFQKQLVKNNCFCPIELSHDIMGTECITFNATGPTLVIHFFISKLKIL